MSEATRGQPAFQTTKTKGNAHFPVLRLSGSALSPAIPAVGVFPACDEWDQPLKHWQARL